MRWTTILVVLVALAGAGCKEVKKEIDTPGPPPPFDPKDARLDPNLIRREPIDNQEKPDKRADAPLEEPNEKTK